MDQVLLSIPKPQKVMKIARNEEIREYEALAASIGFKPAAISEARLLSWLEENSMPIYELDKVMAYLDQLFKNAGTGWFWAPLRKKDIWPYNLTKPLHMPNYKGGNGSVGWFESEIYQRAIPLSVLQTVQKVGAAFPDLLFFVSEAKVIRPDPFLMVTKFGMPHIVLECWNEPGFNR